MLLHGKYLGRPYLLLEPGFWCPEFAKSVRSTSYRKVTPCCIFLPGCAVWGTSTKLSTSGRNVNNVSCRFIHFFILQIMIWRCIITIFLKCSGLSETANVYPEDVNLSPNKMLGILSPELPLFPKS